MTSWKSQIVKSDEKFKAWFQYIEEFHYAHSVFYFLVNPQVSLSHFRNYLLTLLKLVFFGYPSYLLNRSRYSNPWKLQSLVNSWIEEIEKDFDHVLILEELDKSLAVLVLKLCWSIEDVAHLKLNSMAWLTKHFNFYIFEFLNH